MSRAHERRLSDGSTPSRRAPRPVDRLPEGVEPELGDLREALGNAAMSRILDRRTSDAIDSELGRGTPLRDAREPGREGPGADHGAIGEGADGVRIHDDATAADLSRRVGAVAFTFGRDIFLAADAPDLDSPAGSRMLGHELTHVRQQRASGTTHPRRVSAPGSAAERQAARSAGAESGPAAPVSAGTVHREVPEQENLEMRSDTVHRAIAIEEMEAEAEAEETPAAPAEPKAEEAPAKSGEPAAPANPAASALFQVAVTDKIRFASDNLQSDKPDAKAAYDAFKEARVAVRAVSGTYASSDPELFAKILVFGNAMQAILEALGPMAGVKRNLSDVAASVPPFVAEATEIGGMLR